MNPPFTASFFAIRKKGTNLYLPACERGATWTEPTDISAAVPRLFLTRKAANMALRYWVRGRFTTRYVEDEGAFGLPSSVPGGIQCEAVPERDIREMEVIPLYLRPSQSDIPYGASHA